MSATGKDTNASTTPSFISALVVAAITVGAFTTVWLVLHSRKNLRRVFQPRVELAPESKRPQPLPDNLVGFWKGVFGTPDQDVIVANGLDAYFFVRFLKVFGMQMLVPYFLLTFIICIPLA
jgi:calcium permeable stress-gated cation channel